MCVGSLPSTMTKSAMYLPPLPALRDFVNMYRLNARKILSQNYLMDMNVIRKIVRKAGDITDNYVIEIGPGPGGITRAILEQNCKRLDVIEIDSRFIPPLEVLQLASNNRMHIYEENVLKADIEKIWRNASVPTIPWYDECDQPPMHIIGNLPFNIASPLIIKFLKEMSYQTGPWSFGRVPLTLTFQSEVARRIVSPVDVDTRSRISLMCQYLTEPKLLFEIPGDCFVPKPQVNVGVVRFEPRVEPLIQASFELVEKMARHLFIHKRKFIAKNIRTLYPDNMQTKMTHDLLKNCCIAPDNHCIKIGMDEFAAMCMYYQKQCNEIPGLFLYNHSKRKTLDELKELPNALPPVYESLRVNQIENEGIPLPEFSKHFGDR